MKRILLSLLFVISSMTDGYSQKASWKSTSESELKSFPKMERVSMPTKFELYNLNLEELKTKLINAPLDLTSSFSNVVVAFPNAEGEMLNYRIYESPIMEKELSDKYPNIKSYSGQGVEDSSATIRFSVTIFGLHAMSLSGKTGSFFIDTFTKDLKNYIVYKKSDVFTTRNFKCLVEDVMPLPNDLEINLEEQLQRASDGQFRIFRLAMACTIEYAAFHVNAAGLSGGTLAAKKGAVLAAMGVTMTRVNGIYERDMSLRMNLVGTNDLVIFIDSDTFSNDNASNLINESQTQITALIGSANFDIGHTVSTGGGGLAGPSPCVNSSKARGITGSPSPVGDPFDIDYVAHEIGHQFGANHTFNNSCGGNVNAGTAVEPGSGSTIMAYAGICSPNVQNNSDAHFHAISMGEMNARIASTATCAPVNPNSNSAPVVTAGPNYTIPNGTAFILKGSSTDANGDSMTYCWEQTNTQISTQPPLQSSTVGPNFRSNPPANSPNRYMPTFSSVMAGNLAPTWEVVPTVARSMAFALTVRDNRMPNGGQTGRGNMIVTTAAVGPFRITSPSVENTSWTAGNSETITWDVAGTTANNINTSNVNILFSSDNGVTFTTLVANTLNDGTESITVPNVTQAYCRIMIEPVGNIYYALSKNISVGYVVTTTTTCNTYSSSPAATIVEQAPLAYQNFSIVIPAMTGTISDVNVTANISHRVNQLYIGMNHPDAGSFVQLFVKDDYSCNNGTSSMVTTFDDSGANFVCIGAAGSNTYKPTSPLSFYNGKTTAGTWLFRVADVTAGTSGTLNSFSFNICTSNTTVLLSSESFGLDSFSLYPNPNNGAFQVQFTSNSSNEIKIGVHDMRGREIFNKTYQNNGLFNESLQLNNVQAGIYLVTVQDGSKKEVKKIIIE
jgi:hypothetical protein